MVEAKQTSDFYTEVKQLAIKNTEVYRKLVCLAQQNDDNSEVVLSKYYFGSEEHQQQFESDCVSILQEQTSDSVMQIIDLYQDEDG